MFYRRIEVGGLAHVPARGPLIVAANHHNALVDAMLLIATIPRRLAPLAKAPLFRNPLIAPFLWLVGAIPVHRRQDAPAPGADNALMFAAATEALRRGGAILIFPEGVSQAEPMLLPLRTGVARLTLDAVAKAGADVTVLPVGLVFHRPGDFRVGTAVVEVGAPVRVDDVVRSEAPTGTLRPANETAVRTLTDRVTAALRSLIVEAGDVQTLRLLDVAYELWRADDETPPPGDRLAWMREAARRSSTLAPELRERVDRLRRELERYDKDAADSNAARGRTPREGATRSRALRDGVALVLGLPLALLGVVVHGLPYRVVTMIVRALRPDPDTSATYQLIAGFVVFPLAWIAEAVVITRLLGPWGLAAFLVALVPSGFLALSWRERIGRFPREFGAAISGPGDARLAVRRQWLRQELIALDDLTRT